MTVMEHLRRHVSDAVGVPAIAGGVPPLDVLRGAQWSTAFEAAMRNRLLMGAFRYGDLRRQDLGAYDLPGEAEKRLALYRQDGNGEHLVDAANMLLLEFVRIGERMTPVDDAQHSKAAE